MGSSNEQYEVYTNLNTWRRVANQKKRFLILPTISYARRYGHTSVTST